MYILIGIALVMIIIVTIMYNGLINKKNQVENAKEFMGKYNLMIVPLLNGSGIRIGFSSYTTSRTNR